MDDGKKIRFSVSALALFLVGQVSANIFPDADKLGAHVGAMAYCSERLASDDDQGKYKTLGLKLLKDFDALSSDDKKSALVYKKAAEDDGDYLGDALDADRCESIRKLLFLD